MEKYTIHPFKKLIIREDVVFDNKLSLDRLNDDLSYKREKARAKGEDHMDFLESIKGTRGKAGRMIIPETGWVQVQVTKDVTYDEVWKIAMGKVGNKDFIL